MRIYKALPFQRECCAVCGFPIRCDRDKLEDATRRRHPPALRATPFKGGLFRVGHGVKSPFDLDLVFAPDGIEKFEDAWTRRVEVEGFPVCHIDDIIASEEAAGRVKDLESLPRLRSFRTYWLKTRNR